MCWRLGHGVPPFSSSGLRFLCSPDGIVADQSASEGVHSLLPISPVPRPRVNLWPASLGRPLSLSALRLPTNEGGGEGLSCFLSMPVH